MQKIALIEFGGSHAECLLSQFHALKNSNCHLTYIGTEELWKQNPSLHPFADQTHFIHFEGKAIGDFKKALRLNRFLKQQGISKAIFNTAQGGHVRNMCLFAPGSVEFIGIIHTLKKFRGSFTQKLISKKIKKYFVLNDYFKDQLQDEKGLRIESFYPLRFPDFQKEVEKTAGEIWVTIIGGVENRRKDLMGSIPLMKLLPPHFKFIFLGKSDKNKDEVKEFMKVIELENLNNRIKLFNHFVAEDDFDAHLKKTDFIWPMVHPSTASADQYFRNQISGAINVAFAYKIPLWIHEEYTSAWKDLENSIHYRMDQFPTEENLLLAEGQKIKADLLASYKFKCETQEQIFSNFVLH